MRSAGILWPPPKDKNEARAKKKGHRHNKNRAMQMQRHGVASLQRSPTDLYAFHNGIVFKDGAAIQKQQKPLHVSNTTHVVCSEQRAHTNNLHVQIGLLNVQHDS